MNGPGAEAYVEQLLRNESWARRLAFRLVRDAAAADDLVQEAWMAFLRRRPDLGRPVRPWLGAALRNLVRFRFRSAARRARRESEPRPSAAPPDPAEMAERLEAHRRLVAAVGELDEPLRAVVVLRYYDDLLSAEIGARLGVPAGTVRFRLKRALEILEGKLRSERGSGLLWVLPFLPLAAAWPAAAALVRAPRDPSPAASPAAAPPASRPSPALGRPFLVTWGAWVLAAASTLTALWLQGELRGARRRLAEVPPAPPALEARPSPSLVADLARERERADRLDAELAAAREELAAARRAPPGPPAPEGLSPELLARLRELAGLMAEGEEVARALSERGIDPGSPPDAGSEDPAVADLLARRDGQMEKVTAILMPLVASPAEIDALSDAIAGERDLDLARAMVTVLAGKKLGLDLGGAEAGARMNERLVALYRAPDLHESVRASVLAAIDLRAESARDLREEVYAIAAGSGEGDLREVAISHLSALEEPRAEAVLRDLARFDPSSAIRMAAVGALGSRPSAKQDEAILPFLEDLARTERDEGVRRRIEEVRAHLRRYR